MRLRLDVVQLLGWLQLFLFANLIIHSSGARTIPEKRINLITPINLRIEGSAKTTFEGIVFTRGHSVTTPSGGTHECDGLNNNINPKAGPTAISALDDAAHNAGFSFDGTFDPEFDDFFITSIGPDTQTPTAFWGLLVDFQFAPVGGCQQEVKPGQKVLWAFNAFNVTAFLDLSGPVVAISKGNGTTFTVSDGQTGAPIEGATVEGQSTDKNGHVNIVFDGPGRKALKASKEGTIRSNALDVLVL